MRLWTEDDLLKVRTARVRGVRTVQYSDRSVTYTSDAEMRQVERDILRDLAAASARPRQTTVVTGRGF